MKKIKTLAKRELFSYLHSPVSYIYLVCFLVALSGFTFIIGKFYESNNASLEVFFLFHPWLYLFLIPAIGMRLWSEEKKENTIEVLSTLPYSVAQLVLGKFLAAWIFVLIGLFLTFPIILTTAYLGSPDYGAIICGYLGSWLMAGCFLAITALTSSLTQNQVISFVSSTLICLALVLLGFGVFQQYISFVPVWAREFIANLGCITHFAQLTRGIIDSRNLLYFLSIMTCFLILNASALEMRKRVALNIGNVIAIFFAVLAINFISQSLYFRLDLTEGKLYTLSEASKKIVTQIDEPVTLNYFFSSSNETLPIKIKNYGKHIQELLGEFAELSNHLTVRTYDPKPDSDAESMATKYGIKGAKAANTTFFMGLASRVGENVVRLPFFDPRRESFLEYDIANLLSQLTKKRKKTLGVLAGFSIRPPLLLPGRSSTQPYQWAFTEELKKTFDLKYLSASDHEIPEVVDTLLVVHPRNFPPPIEYAIDQFILSGKRAVLLVDPSARSIPDIRRSAQMSKFLGPQGSSSSLPNVFKTLELEYLFDSIAVDERFASVVSTPKGSIRYPLWLSLQRGAFSQTNVASSNLRSALFIEAGWVKPKKGSNLKYDSLVSTSEQSGIVSNILTKVMAASPLSYDKVQERLSLAGIVTGAFKSSYRKRPEKSEYKKEHIQVAKEQNSVAVIADVDFLNNQYSLKLNNFLGTPTLQPTNHNIALLANTLDLLGGNPELITIRTRDSFSRPFTRVAELQQSAQRKWLQTEESLSKRVRKLEEKLNELRSTRSEGSRLVLSKQQRQEIQKFKLEQQKLKQQRREVRKKLRQEVEELGVFLILVNMGVIPLGVLLFGLWTYISRNKSFSFRRPRYATV